ncbi:MAG TPA: hypothetical protein ACFYEK_01060 [Candidatus Wunengus sp. YC60]|uniref:hypothetical protein n=1 Tax=Candidatus Wunengus sp. YC60 TaxID=3367697 RepID=UPI004024E608
MTKFTGSLSSELVAVDWVNNVDKLDIPATPTGGPAKYYIILTSVFPTGQSKETRIQFATSAARDTSYTNYITNFVTATA